MSHSLKSIGLKRGPDKCYCECLAFVTDPFNYPLAPHHRLDGFDCGNATLNDGLRRRAAKNEAGGASRTFVVCDDQGDVIGYYTLSAGAVAHEGAPGKVHRNMPDPIPIMVLGRLAVDHRWQGKDIGKGLLKDAVQRSIVVSQQVGVRALLVHAISEEAKRFYQRFGFRESPANSMTLMITLAEGRAAL